MGAQLKRADKAGARFAVFVGGEEIAAGRFGFKDLSSGVQESLDEPTIVTRIGEAND
jgi:histidyl-tRNA synthetase